MLLGNATNFFYLRKMETIKFYFYFLDSQFTGFAPIIRITVFIVMLLILMYIISLIRLFITNKRIQIRNRRWNNVKKHYESKLRKIFFSTTNFDSDKIKTQIGLNKTNIKFKWQKELLTDLFLSIKREENTNNKINIENYNTALALFDLETHWIKEISVGNLQRRLQGLRKLEKLTNDVSGGIIAPLLHHRNEDLRKLARSEYIKFDSSDIFKFLEEEDFDKKFNRLDEIRIHDSLKKKSQEYQLPLFNQWIKNTGSINYKCFLIRETGYFNQLESAPFLLDLFQQTDDTKVKTEIANTLGVMKYKDALPVFYSNFRLSRLAVQNAIITAIGMIGKKESVPFLTDSYKLAYNDETRNNIMESIRRCGGKTNITAQQVGNSYPSTSTNIAIQGI